MRHGPRPSASASVSEGAFKEPLAYKKSRDESSLLLILATPEFVGRQATLRPMDFRNIADKISCPPGKFLHNCHFKQSIKCLIESRKRA